jgi:mannose-6-phosphate isomerase-like protein (cupin superfamily)
MGVATKSFDSPDEQRTPDKTTVDVVDLNGIKVARTESCQVHHVGAIVSGRIHVVPEDGAEVDLGPGDAYVIDPGHDAWVVGDEPCVGYEFDSTAAAQYAKG